MFEQKGLLEGFWPTSQSFCKWLSICIWLIETMVIFLCRSYFTIGASNICGCQDWHGCIMKPTVIGEEGIQPYKFSACSSEQFQQWMGDGHALCLLNKPNQLADFGSCGNGVIDDGEDCDCGSAEECESVDPCCDPVTCRLKRESECSTGPCCDNCKVSASLRSFSIRVTDIHVLKISSAPPDFHAASPITSVISPRFARGSAVNALPTCLWKTPFPVIKAKGIASMGIVRWWRINVEQYGVGWLTRPMNHVSGNSTLVAHLMGIVGKSGMPDNTNPVNESKCPSSRCMFTYNRQQMLSGKIYQRL